MEPVQILASGLTLEESKAKRQEKQAARYRHRLGTYVPSGDSRELLAALMATSPRKSPTPRKSIASGSNKPRKTAKTSMKGKSNDETADDSTQEMKKQTKSKKSTGRKSVKVAGSSKKETQAKVNEKKVSKRSMSETRANTAEEEGSEPKSSTSHRTDKSAGTSNSKTTRLSKNSTTTRKPKLSKASSRSTTIGGDFGNQPTTPEPTQHKFKKSSSKPPPTQIDDESDDLAIKKVKAPRKVDNGKARAIESPPKTFESAGTDVDLEDPRRELSNMKPLLTEESSLRDAYPDVRETITAPIISRVASDRRNVCEEQEEQKPRPKKRGRPHKDEVGEEPPAKRGKTQKADDSEVNGSAKSKPKRQAKKPSPKPKSTITKGRTRKKADTPPEMSNTEKEEPTPSETKVSGSRKRQWQGLDDGSGEEKRDEPPDGDEPTFNLNRVRLDSIPPEGLIIRKKNGIVEKLLPLVIKPKRKAPRNRGKTRSSHKRAIPAHVLKYIGPTRIGSPLKAPEGTDTDDDLNL